jgi:hypothetical protein
MFDHRHFSFLEKFGSGDGARITEETGKSHEASKFDPER